MKNITVLNVSNVRMSITVHERDLLVQLSVWMSSRPLRQRTLLLGVAECYEGAVCAHDTNEKSLIELAVEFRAYVVACVEHMSQRGLEEYWRHGERT